MSSSRGLARPRSGLAAREIAFVLILAAGAWAATLILAQGMAGMTGTMGLGLAAFVPIWTLMMAAMMLPSVTPTASLYARTVQDNRPVRIAGLVAGYLAVGAAAGLPACGLAWLAGWLTGRHPTAAHVMAVGAFAVCGIYQLGSLKDWCLAHCRSPLALLLHYGSYRGRLRDLRAGAHHGGYCLGCCWALMAALFALGVMSLTWMAVVAALIAFEKTVPWRRAATWGTAAILLVLAVAVAASPHDVPGLVVPSSPTAMHAMDAMNGMH